MNRKELEQFIPKFRKEALSIKEFSKLPKKEKDQYILELTKIPTNELADVDIYLLKFYNILEEKQNNFFTIED
jgi:hypothetical protein